MQFLQTLNHCSANSPSPGLTKLIPENNIQPFPDHPYLILLPVCQPLYPQRLRKTPSANCPHLAESSQQTAACLSEGPRAVCASARATLRIVPYCICCTQLACINSLMENTKKSKKRNQVCSKNDKAKQTVPFLLPWWLTTITVTPSCSVWLFFTVISVVIVVIVFVLWPSQIDSPKKIFDNSTGKITYQGQFWKNKTLAMKFWDCLSVACVRVTLVWGWGWRHTSRGAMEADRDTALNSWIAQRRYYRDSFK